MKPMKTLFAAAVIAATLTNPKPAAAEPLTLATAAVAIGAVAAYVYVVKEAWALGEHIADNYM